MKFAYHKMIMFFAELYNIIYWYHNDKNLMIETIEYNSMSKFGTS